MRCLEPEDNTS